MLFTSFRLFCFVCLVVCYYLWFGSVCFACYVFVFAVYLLPSALVLFCAEFVNSVVICVICSRWCFVLVLLFVYCFC